MNTSLTPTTSITVGTLFDCEFSIDTLREYKYNPAWRHNMAGCRILKFLQDMYDLNITYVIDSTPVGKRKDIDFYAKPMPISPAIFEFATPVQPVLRWKYGFILSYPRDCILYLNYYSKPFSRRTWNCLYGMTIMFALIFYFLSWFEKRTTGLNYECSFAIELLLTVGGHCQQAFPVLTYASSRRTAYLTFFLYTFVIYTFYTSNLLSYLVNDVDNAVHLDKLFESDYDIAVLDTMKDILYDNYTYHSLYNSFTEIPKQLRSPKFVNMSTALHDIRFKKTALLSDYITMYPSLSRHFSNQEICHLKEIDLSSDVRTYLFSSKHFLFREQFVIGSVQFNLDATLKCR
ncbi:hypothetical protein ACJJTC_019424 [Scirpophaga incertulas]